MVYDTSGSFEGKNKKPRVKVVGKLVGIRCDSSRMKVFDPEKGVFDWLELAIITGQDKDGSDIYQNISVYKVDFEKMSELARADELLKSKQKPQVEIECYKSETVAVDKETKKPIVENGDVKMWVNWRASKDDAINTFKILADNADNEVIETPIKTSEKIEG